MMRSRAVAGDRRFYGVVEAVVTANEDPDRQGRIKVVFPWFDGGETETDWIRVVNPYAGPEYGQVWIPELETEVLVAYVHGDMHRPIVLGGLYNGSDLPPSSRSGDVDQKLIKTKHGHELLFDDGDNKRVRVTTAAGHELDLDDDGKRVRARTSGGHQVDLDDGGRVNIESSGGQSVLIDDAGGSITIDTGQGQTITLDGSSVTISGGSVTIDSSSISLGEGATEKLVLGMQFMTLFNAHVHSSPLFGIPTSPPVSPMTPAQLSSVTKTL